MIKCYLMNNIEEEYVPEYKNFVDWLSIIDCEDMSEVNIKIITPKEMRNFNKLYKNEDKVSDILAFPNTISFNNGKNILGDIVMCANKINNDSNTYNKKNIERWAHLTIHSTLHLLGYDHNNDKNRNIMESKEIDILKKFNIFNPYEI